MATAKLNPFDQLIRTAQLRQARPAAQVAARPDAVPDSLTHQLVVHLRQAGPATTSCLCHVIDRESRLVWGLLKVPRLRGEVVFEAGMWSVVPTYDAAEKAEIAAAASLLGRHGFTVRRTRGAAP